jgi:hypothetical protein
VTLSAGSLSAGKIITVEAFGAFDDPASSLPNMTFKLKLGSVAIVTQTRTVTAANWHLKAAITVRTAGASGSVVGTMAIIHDNAGMSLFGFDSQTVTVDTTGALTVDLRASMDDYTGAERVVGEQGVVRAE